MAGQSLTHRPFFVQPYYGDKTPNRWSLTKLFGVLETFMQLAAHILVLVGSGMMLLGSLFFRKPGVSLRTTFPVWKANKYLTPPGAWLCIGGVVVTLFGLALSFALEATDIGIGTYGIIGFFVAVFAPLSVLFALDRYLKKTKSEQWMSRYYICLAVAIVLVGIFLLLRFLA